MPLPIDDVMAKLKTIVLAAGKGTRMKSNLPKVLHSVCGRPMIEYVLEAVQKSGSLKNYVILGHQIKQVASRLPSDVEVIHQTKQLGTAHAVKMTKKYFSGYDGDVLIVCGDTPLLTSRTLNQLISVYRRKKAACAMLTTRIDDPSGYGRIIRGDKGDFVAVREHKDATSEEKEISEINVGVYCVHSKVLFKALEKVKINPKKKEYYLTDIIEILHRQNEKVIAVCTEDDEECLGVNDRIDLAAANEVMRYRCLEKLMLGGVTVVDPASTFVASTTKVGRDTIIYPFTYIDGDVVIGRECEIGPYARIRGGSRINDHVSIGHFTEISRSTIGNGTFMRHFSFVGDAVVGKKVNIGAGFVSANFDGKNKNQTRIGDEAFLGSGSICVAPTTVGKKAIVGAGSVVTSGTRIPNGAVAKGVPAKINRRR